VNAIELATLAGFFAGEGNITISGGNWPTLYAAIGNSEKSWVSLFYDNFGGSMYVEQPKYKGAKFMFRWRVSGKKAVNFLETIQPFLIGEKSEQLKLGLKFQELKLQVKAPVKYTEEQFRQMREVHQEMQSLRRTAAETNRKDASPWRNDSPVLEVIPE
jgi:hypothetical protein